MSLSISRRAVLALGLVLPACGKTAPRGALGPKKEEDLFALLPPEPLALATLDARKLQNSKTLLAKWREVSAPFAPVLLSAGIDAERDVDHITLASYAFQGFDVAMMVQGRFDPKKVERTLAAPEASLGGALVQSEYAGKKLFTVKNVGFSVLSDKVILGGSEGAIRRMLERARDGGAVRNIAQGLSEVLSDTDKPISFAADFGTQPLAHAAIGPIDLGFLSGLKFARGAVTWAPDPHADVALSFGKESEAGVATKGIDRLSEMLRSLRNLFRSLPEVRDLSVTQEKEKVRLAFTVDEKSLTSALGLLRL